MTSGTEILCVETVDFRDKEAEDQNFYSCLMENLQSYKNFL